jgi:C-terminal processing protease CtpA/Prc
MSRRSLVPLVGLVALAANTCTKAPVTSQARAIFGDSTGTGVTLVADRQSRSWVVRRVWKDSPAAKAGVVEGDRVLTLNGITLPEARVVDPCGPETLSELPSAVRKRIDAAGNGGVLRMRLERNGRPLDLSVRREPLAATYSAAQSPGSTAADPIICMLCDKNCPGALNNEGYWTCVITNECGTQTVQCKDPCLTS